MPFHSHTSRTLRRVLRELLFCFALGAAFAPGIAALVSITPVLAQSEAVAGEEDQTNTATDAEDEVNATPSEVDLELPPAVVQSLHATGLRYSGIRLIMEQAEASLLRNELDEQDISEIRERILPLIDEARTLVIEFDPILSQLRTRQTNLGPPPGDGEPPESGALREARAGLTQAITEIDAVVKRGQLLVSRGEEIITLLAERRRDLFARTLFERGQSILSPTLWQQAFEDLPASTRAIQLLLTDSSRSIYSRLTPPMTAGVLTTLLAALLLITVVRNRLLRIVIRKSEIAEPNSFAKAIGAAWVALLYFLLPFISVYIIILAMHLTGVVPDRFSELLSGLAGSIWIYFFLTALARGVLAPSAPAWRLAPYSTLTAWKLYGLITTMAAIFAIDRFLDTVLNLVAAPLEVDVAVTALAAMLIALIVILCLRAAASADVDEHDDRGAGEGGSSPSASVLTPRRALIRLALWVTSLTILVSALLGYTALASYIAAQAVSASAVITVLVLLLIMVEHGFDKLSDPSFAVARTLTRTVGIGQSTIGQTAALASGLLKLVLILLAGVTLLAPWGFDPSDWSAWFRKAFFGFKLGDVTISLSAILAAIALFFIGVLITRAFQRWLENKYLPRTKLDTGIRSSLSTAASYLGFAAAAAFAVSFVGLDLANLAIVAGALSVGIGFGLQSIVNNFVSGLILLAERPIKVGDWIAVGGEQGYVRRISVRATQIETFDRSTVVVPNSDLISGVVKNMMLNNMMGRVVIKIGVSYNSDVDHVREVMLECARAHDRVLSYPAPNVYFMEFGESSLDFALYAYIPDVDYVLTVHSDLRYAIFRRFREEEIEIPFPQRDLHLRSTVSPTPIDAPEIEPSAAETGIAKSET